MYIKSNLMHRMVYDVNFIKKKNWDDTISFLNLHVLCVMCTQKTVWPDLDKKSVSCKIMDVNVNHVQTYYCKRPFIFWTGLISFWCWTFIQVCSFPLILYNRSLCCIRKFFLPSTTHNWFPLQINIILQLNELVWSVDSPLAVDKLLSFKFWFRMC